MMYLSGTWESILLPFLAGLALSFLGSLPPGIISMTVTSVSIRKGIEAALIVGAGAAVIEIIQAWLSIQFTLLYVEQEAVSHYFQLATIPIFLGLGIYYWLVQTSPPQNKPYSFEQSFKLGAGVSTLNLLAFPYWIFYGTYLQHQGILPSNQLAIGAISLGVGIGTFVLLGIYAKAGQLLLNRLPLVNTWVNKGVGTIMLGLGTWQVVLLVNT